MYLKEGGQPTEGDHSVFSHTSNSGGWLEIPSFDGMTYIGIKATTPSATFWITAIESEAHVQLSQGVPLNAEIPNTGSEMHFVLHSESATQDLNLQVTVFEGSIEMSATPEGEHSDVNHLLHKTFHFSF